MLGCLIIGLTVNDLCLSLHPEWVFIYFPFGSGFLSHTSSHILPLFFFWLHTHNQPLTYDVLRGVLGDATDAFPDQYFHLGGDEVTPCV
jgi:hypothetical protein